MSQDLPNPQRTGLFLQAATIGFAAAVAMWLIGFVTHLPGLRAPTPVVGALLLLAHVATGVVAANCLTTRVVKVAGGAGLVAGTVNLLVLSGVLASDQAGSALPANAAVIAIAYVAFSGIVAAVSAGGARAIGIRAAPQAAMRTRETWLARFAAVAAFSAAPVILSGGLVTSAGAGLAVHDWPGSYGQVMWLYPLSRMTGGVYYEHAHRLFGTLVGLTTIVLVVLAFLNTRRSLPRIAAVVALVAVVAQGVMGGLRVTSADAPVGQDLSTLTPDTVPADAPANFALTTDNATSRGLAIVHGVFGQLTVAWLAACTAFMAPRFGRTGDPAVVDRPIHDRFLRRTTGVLLGVLLFQLLLGATTRHLEHFHVLMTHMGFAFVVVVVCFIAGLRAAKHRGTPVRLPGMGVAHASGLQVVLGFGAMFSVLPYDRVGPEPWHAVLLATAHQALGAVILANAAMLAAWTYRLTARHAAPAVRSAVASPA